MEKPLVAKIHSGVKKTFVDYEVKAKKHVPDANYNVRTSLEHKRTRSNWCKDMRHTIATDCEKETKRLNFPEPSTYKPQHKITEPRVLGAFNLKGAKDDFSFVADA